MNDATSAITYTVIVTIDDHETVFTFESKEQAEAFAQVERARLTEKEARLLRGEAFGGGSASPMPRLKERFH